MRELLRKDRLKLCVRLFAPILILALCLSVLSQHVTHTLWQTLPSTLSSINPLIWLAALGFTALSFWAIGRYDGVAHTHLQTGLPVSQARRGGTISIAVGQTLGFGVFTGALVRWRLLPDLTLSRALALSAFVSVTFILGWMFVTAVASLLLPAPSWTFWPAVAVVTAGPALAIGIFRWPVLRLKSVRLHMPSLRMTGSIIAWSAVDLCAAGAALWMLLPSDADVSLTAFLPIYMIALGAALISNTPGGVGPFELVLISALPQISPDALMVSVVAFRLVFYAVPACIGAAFLVRPFPSCDRAAEYPMPALTLREAPRSEVSVILQNGGTMERTRNGAFAAWTTGQTVTALFDPIRGGMSETLQALRALSAAKGRWPIAYKCSSRCALIARGEGWSILHVADDALIKTQTYSLNTPSRRTLRRKLRSIEKAGVQIVPIEIVSTSELEHIDAEWSARLGPARGGTMGRYSPEYLKCQFALAAKVDGKAVAFVSFFTSQNEWTLDLMRQTEDAPAGVMHALVHDCIETAKAHGIPSVSLAATPACPDPSSAVWRHIAGQVVERAGGPGLRQFKSAFAPNWHPRYAAAPNSIKLAVGLVDIAREIHNPRPIKASSLNDIHDLHEYYEFDSRRRA
ncbi:MAG: phosphatidylglycerol lysyltransferase domain-containing protein [Paracoccaceae bacterium]